MKKTITNPVIKDKVTFVKTAEETGGEVTELEIELEPGGENGLHYHNTYDETFTALDGKLGVRLSKKMQKILEPGESYHVKRGEVHAFFNPSGEKIRFRVELTPGHTGFEQSLRILYGLAHENKVNSGGIPKNLTELSVVAKLSEMRSPNPALRMLNPLFMWIAGRAERNGKQKRLVEKYCI